jgi:hypothetical protein
MIEVEEKMVERLESFRSLEDGWLGTGTFKPNPAVLDFVIAMIKSERFGPLLEDWVVGPTGDGGLAFEFEDRENAPGHTWDIEIYYKKHSSNTSQFVLEVLEMTDVREKDADYNEFEFRARDVWQREFKRFFFAALCRDIFNL